MCLKLSRKLLINLFFIPLFSYAQAGDFLSVCDRSPKIKDVILEKAKKMDRNIECSDDDLMRLVLSEITSINLGLWDWTGSIYYLLTSRTTLKAGDFSGMTALRLLSFANNEIEESIPPGTFSNLPALETLNLVGNRLKSIPQFSNLPALETISLGGNEIETTSPGAFSNLPALELIILTGNEIESISLGTFSNLPALQDLHLRGNEIETILTGTFSNFPALKRIQLGNNEIETISPGAFSNLPALTWIAFQDNEIESISPDAFYGLSAPKVRILLEDNPLDEEATRAAFATRENIELIWNWE